MRLRIFLAAPVFSQKNRNWEGSLRFYPGFSESDSRVIMLNNFNPIIAKLSINCCPFFKGVFKIFKGF